MTHYATDVRKAVIPAAGLGTRFLPYTKSQPKEMLPLLDRPTIQYVVEEAVASGIEQIYMITSSGKDAIQHHFDDTSARVINALKNKKQERLIEELEALAEIDIVYKTQRRPEGLGDALYYAKKWVGDEPFAVALGDDIVQSRMPCIKQLIDVHQRLREHYNGPASVVAVEGVDPEKVSSYGIVDLGDTITDPNTRVIKTLVEKPEVHKAPSNTGIVGRYVFSPSIFRSLGVTNAAAIGKEKQLTDGMLHLLKTEPIAAHKFRGRRLDLGQPFSWLTANIEAALADPQMGTPMREYLKKLQV